MNGCDRKAEEANFNAGMPERIRLLQGPILVLGASGFVGANLLRSIRAVRADVVGTASRLPAWRLQDCSPETVREVDVLVLEDLQALLDSVRPRTVLNCIAYGAYSFQTDPEIIYRTNFLATAQLLRELQNRGIAAYVQAGSSSEYGLNSAGPLEADALVPNSDYAVSKAATASLIRYYGSSHSMPCLNLRLYSVYGPLEDPSRLIPTLVGHGLKGGLPEFVAPDISRDFVYVDDVVDAFVCAATRLRPEIFGMSFNIGTGRKTTIGELAQTARDAFSVEAKPQFTMANRSWDVADWYADPTAAREFLGWEASTPLSEGLSKTAEWLESLGDRIEYITAGKEFAVDNEYSVSAVIACYRDAEAIPIMHARLTETFRSLGIDYEIIFVNDNSPDDSERVIAEITSRDVHTVGVSHSRNFGSQAAFLSGMGIATRRACVLLDGDLQDPPELIIGFHQRWKEGYQVVYGRRVDREAPWFMRHAYRAFYRLFAKLAQFEVPRDAGDFSLMDRPVVDHLLQFPERDLFLRGLRAYAGFRQTGVDYVRPERMFGVSTNNVRKNLGWAKRGILSVSNVPLNLVTLGGGILLAASVFLAVLVISLKVIAPSIAPAGFTTVIVAILILGSLNLFAIGIVGEYVGRTFEETKRRPRFIRRAIIRNGEIRTIVAGGTEAQHHDS
jgi:nucleoside-diphosphate-sugar epimerase/glycosyltransferase involved in cell wall biosynthesis